jgi:hypothetical protein
MFRLFPAAPYRSRLSQLPGTAPVTTVSLTRLPRPSLRAAHHRPLLRLPDTAARRSGPQRSDTVPHAYVPQLVFIAASLGRPS